MKIFIHRVMMEVESDILKNDMILNKIYYNPHLRRYYELGALINRDRKVNKFENCYEFSIISEVKMLNNLVSTEMRLWIFSVSNQGVR